MTINDEKKNIRQGRDKANEFVKLQLAEHQAGYKEFVKRIENTNLQDGAAMQEIWGICIQCAPEEAKVIFQAACDFLTGKTKDFVVNTQYDNLIKECVEQGATLEININGEIKIVSDGIPQKDCIYINRKNYEESKKSANLKILSKELRLDNFDKETKKQMDYLGFTLFSYYFVFSTEFLQKLKELAIQEKNLTIIYAYYYIACDHGFKKITEILPHILLTGGLGFEGVHVFSAIVQKFVDASMTVGHESKASWKELADHTESDDVWKEVSNKLRKVEGNRGQKKKFVLLAELLKGNKQAILAKISNFLQENAEAQSLAYLLWILQKTSCISCNKYSTFHQALSENFHLDLGIRVPQSRYKELVDEPEMLNDKAETWQRAKAVIDKWIPIFNHCR